MRAELKTLRFISIKFFFQKILSFFFCYFFVHIIVNVACAEDIPFNHAANWGGTGLMEIPTARIIDDGIMRLGYAQAKPYSWYIGALGIFPGCELSGRYTEISNVPSDLGSDFGAYKDKTIDFKYQIIPESKKFPAIAIGLQDFIGTTLFEAQYLVFSRQIFPLDLTIGLGTKRLNGPISFSFFDKIGIFGGIEWALNERLHFLAEYNPIEYEKDKKIKGVPQGASLPLNFGLRAKILPDLDIGISYQRGNTLAFMCNLQFKLGKPLNPKKPDPPLWGSVDRHSLKKIKPEIMVTELCRKIETAGFQEVSVSNNNGVLSAEFENNKYLSNQKAVGRVLRILLFHSSKNTRELNVFVTRRRIPLLKISVKPEHLEKYLFGNIPEDIFYELIKIETPPATANPQLRQDLIQSKGNEHWAYQYGVKPDIETYFNDPSGVLKSRIGVKPYISATLWKGGAVNGWFDIPFYSDIRSSNVPPPDAIRSDSWKYSGNDLSLDRLIIDQAFQLSNNTFGRLSTGYFERMYAGIGAEALTFLADGDLAIGIEGDWIKKRKPGTMFDLLNFESHSILGNVYYAIQGADITVHVQYGRFLAGDRGWRFEVSREFDTGAIFGFWYSSTDTDHLTGFNHGYHDKGIFLKLPIRMFLNYETSTRYDYSFSPWARDVGATISHWQNLFNLGSDLMPSGFKAKLNKIKE